MKILAIETSCDETALSIVEALEEGVDIRFSEIKSAINSQAKLHSEFGGVFPNLAKREHSKNFIPLLSKLLNDQSVESIYIDNPTKKHAMEILERYPDRAEDLIEFAVKNKPTDIDYIAVTQGPGLAPALWVGIVFARVLSLIWNIPMVGVNHMEGHIVSVLGRSNKNTDVKLPSLALLISGGHTQVVKVSSWGQYEILGETQDDALGEAYDKVARMLGMSYPGGPEVSKRARLLREQGVSSIYELPRPMANSKDLRFSFSGLKTAVLYKIQEIEKEFNQLDEEKINHICLAFEDSISDVLIKKLSIALANENYQSLIIGGGVIANQHIRNILSNFANENNLEILVPSQDHATDNAVMIGIAGYFTIKRSKPAVAPDIVANGNMSL